MNWYYSILGSYVHVRVFMNGGKCGGLTFCLGEFIDLTGHDQETLERAETFSGEFNKLHINFIHEKK